MADYVCLRCNHALPGNTLIRISAVGHGYMCPKCQGPCFPKEFQDAIHKQMRSPGSALRHVFPFLFAGLGLLFFLLGTGKISF